MSNITVTELQGHTSGGDANTVKVKSGHTLAAQSNATVGGTLGVTGTTTTAQINASGSINTTSNTISVTNSSYPQLQLNSGVKNYHIFNDTGSNSLYFKNNTDAVNGMIMDSSGRVTKPVQPAFQVQGNNGNNVTYGGPAVITHFDATSQSYCFIQGGVTHTASNGRITVPVAGKYMLTLCVYDNDSNTGAHRSGILINGVMIGHTHLEMLNGQTTVAIVANLAANDYIQYQSVYNRAYYMGPNHFYASGYLLG